MKIGRRDEEVISSTIWTPGTDEPTAPSGKRGDQLVKWILETAAKGLKATTTFTMASIRAIQGGTAGYSTRFVGNREIFHRIYTETMVSGFPQRESEEHT